MLIVFVHPLNNAKQDNVDRPMTEDTRTTTNNVGVCSCVLPLISQGNTEPEERTFHYPSAFVLPDLRFRRCK